MNEYTFNNGKYEFCEDRKCDLMMQLRDGDKPHMMCCECIEHFEGKKPQYNELCTTSKLRKNRTLH
jgi:hypothetical protein